MLTTALRSAVIRPIRFIRVLFGLIRYPTKQSRMPTLRFPTTELAARLVGQQRG